MRRGTKITGDSRATTLPTSIGVLAPVVSTERVPDVACVVPSQAAMEQQKPRMGEKVAAAQDYSAKLVSKCGRRRVMVNLT